MHFSVKSDFTAPTVTTIETHHHLAPKDVISWLDGRLHGKVPFRRLTGTDGMFRGGAHVFADSNVFFSPSTGAIFDQDGQVYNHSAKEFSFISPDLSALPKPSRNMPTVDLAGAFMGWGGYTNVGHFLIDCGASIAALRRASVEAPLFCAPLLQWHRDFLDLLDVRTVETESPLISARQMFWSSCMDHYLHSPNMLLNDVREHILAKIRPAMPSKIYLSRSRHADNRRLVNEVDLETHLSDRGFLILHPQEMTIAEQISYVAAADVIVGATGAQMSLSIFAKPDCRVIEICPDLYPGVWIRNLCSLFGLDWHSVFVETGAEIDFDGDPVSQYHFSYSIDPAAISTLVK